MNAFIIAIFVVLAGFSSICIIFICICCYTYCRLLLEAYRRRIARDIESYSEIPGNVIPTAQSTRLTPPPNYNFIEFYPQLSSPTLRNASENETNSGAPPTYNSLKFCMEAQRTTNLPSYEEAMSSTKR